MKNDGKGVQGSRFYGAHTDCCAPLSTVGLSIAYFTIIYLVFFVVPGDRGREKKKR